MINSLFRWVIIVAWIHGCFFIHLFAQRGLPNLVNFTPKEYNANPKNFDLIQDARGVIFIANQDGIMQFDGTYWQILPLPRNTVPNTLEIAPNQQIWVGANNLIGTLSANSLGKLQFKTVSDGGWGNVRKFYLFDNQIYASSDSALLFWDGSSLKPCKFQATQKIWNKGSRLIAHHQWGVGIVQNENFFPLLETKNIPAQKLVALIKIADNHFVIAATDRLWNFKNGVLQPFYSKSEPIYRNGIISDVRLSKNGYLIVSTLRSGAIVLKNNGDILYWLNRNAGLESETVYGTMVDDREHLWLATEQGISFADLNPRITFFTERSGLKGSVNQLYKFQKNLFCATDRGLFFLSTENQIPIFKPVKGIAATTFKMIEYQKQLFVASFSGLFRIEKDSAIVVSKEPTFDLCLSKRGFLYSVMENRIASIKKNPKTKLFELKTLDTLTQNIEFLIEDKRMDWFWAGNERSVTLVHILWDSLDKRFPIPIMATELKPTQTSNKLLISNEGIFKFDNKQWRFVRDSVFEKWAYRPIQFLYKDPKGYLWLNTQEQLFQAAWNDQDKKYQWQKVPIKKIKSLTVNDFYRENDKVFWLATTQGLVRFEPELKELKSSKFFTFPSQITINRDSTIFHGNFWDNQTFALNQTQPTEFYSDLQSIEFAFTATTYEDPTGTYFQYRLLGMDTTWRAWTKNNIFTFNQLPIGDYTLQVRAKNILDEITPIYEYRFNILPFWYQTTWAKVLFYLLGLIAIGLITWAGIVYYTKRLKAQNEWLQQEIAKATAEIQQQNQKLIETNQIILEQKAEIEKDKHIIEEKNQEILDSITYAKRIQNALLPSEAALTHAFGKEHFVVFFPQNIVSGDFYWLTEENNHFILAVADCTGHGVPGGFMTMIGNTLLNQIVGLHNIIQPNLILNELHTAIRTSLKQDEEGSQVRDGMDLTIITYNPHEKTLQIASAQRPIYFIRNGEFQEIKGDKFPIGGKDPERNYTLHTFELLPNDTFYFSSDGYADQFSPQDKKFSTGRLKKLIQQVQDQPLKQQGDILRNAFLEWKGDVEQIDDVLLVGIRFT